MQLQFIRFTFCFSNYLKNGGEQNILKSHYDFVTNQLWVGSSITLKTQTEARRYFPSPRVGQIDVCRKSNI